MNYSRISVGLKVCVSIMGMMGEGCREVLMVELGFEKWVGVFYEAMVVEGKVLVGLVGSMSVVCLEWF